jgi:GSCFA family
VIGYLGRRPKQFAMRTRKITLRMVRHPKIFAQDTRIAFAYCVKRVAFRLIKWLAPDMNSDGSPTVPPPFDQVEPLRALTSPSNAIDTAVIINDNDAIVTSATLNFHLLGIFCDQKAVNWALALFDPLDDTFTFEEIERKLERALVVRLEQDSSVRSRDMLRQFIDHRQATARNRRAYSIGDRANPNAVFWPDPTNKDPAFPAAGRSLYTELPFARKIPLIDETTRVVSAGSCFATEIAHALQKSGYNYLIKEQNKGNPGSYEFLDEGELPNSSAAWGIIFNTPSFRQLVEKAFEVRVLPKILWTQSFRGKLRYFDPFRENIAFESPEAFEGNYPKHLQAVRAAFLEMDIFIITLGLNEIWYFKADGAVFSRSPWRTAPSLVDHRVLTVEENVADLVRMAEILRVHNPSVTIICTLSPIALHATFRGDEQHVVTANAHSKAVLRVAAEEFARRCKNVHYFPSYEVVTSSTESPWHPDQRHVSADAVKNVIGLFHQTYGR